MNLTATPVVSIHRLTLEGRPAAWQPPPGTKRRFDVRRARVAPLLGLSMLGCSLHEVAPGCAAYPFHSHRANEELFFVLAGQGDLRLGTAHHAVKEGDLIGCPVGGPETAHQLTNNGPGPLRYLAISTLIDPEICEYPDSGKVGAYAGEGEGELAHFSRYGSHLDYWDGE